jgi:hypothetical protein
MMAAHFFNFWNRESYHFFCWCSHDSRRSKVGHLIHEAFNRLPQNEWYKMDVDTAYCLKEELGKLLEQELEDLALNVGWTEDFTIGDVDSGEDSLWLPVLSDAMSNIDTETVAEALLIRAGKWAPEKLPPELFSLPRDEEGGE